MIASNDLLPTQQDIDRLQNFTTISQRALNDDRAWAKSYYFSLSVDVDEWKYVPCMEVAWNTVILNGLYVPTVHLTNGIVICDIREAIERYPLFFERYRTLKSTTVQARKMLTFIEACYNRAVVIWIPPYTQYTKPLNMQEILGSYDQGILVEKLIIIVGTGASISIEDVVHATYYSVQTLMRSITYIIEDHAQVRINHTQQLTAQTYDLSGITFYCGQESSTTYTTMISGGFATKVWLDSYLEGVHATITVRGVYALDASQKIDIRTSQMHHASKTYSDLIIKGGLTGNSLAHYEGTIIIKKEALYSEASQDNHNILLSTRARAHSMPSLEVLTNDVRCFHGSAVGQIDLQQLFYAQSRGLSYAHAYRLLLEAFFADVIDKKNLALITQKLENNDEKYS